MLQAGIAAIGVGTSIAGMIGGYSAEKKKKEIAGQIAQEGLKLAAINKQQMDLQRGQLQNQEAGADASYAASNAIFQSEQQAEAVRRQAMEMSASRQALENVRQFQRARAQAVTVANAQGAIGGSSLNSATGQASGQSAFAMDGLVQSLQQGRAMFDINSGIATTKKNLADNLYTLNKSNYQLSYQGFDLAKKGADIQAGIGQLQAQMGEASSQQAMWGGVASLGGSIFNSSSQVANLFGNFGGGGSSGGTAFFPSQSFLNNEWGW